MIKEIEVYITKHYYELLQIAKKYTKNDDWASELLHEVILQLYDKKEIKVKLQDNDLKYYITRIMMVNWCYPTSPFYSKIKKESMFEYNQSDFEDVVDLREEDKHQILEIIEQEYGEIDLFNKVIFDKYMILGSLKKVSVDTQIPLPSIGRYVKDTKQQIKEKTLIRFNKE
jgi:hypothetical protein